MGKFCLLSETGEDLTPPSMKARGLLAFLLMSPEFTRPRSALTATLWSDRGETQARNSLRHALSEIRTALGAHDWVFKTDRKSVGFAPNTIERDVDSAPPSARHDFLEDVNPKDPVFAEWLADRRREFAENLRQSEEPLLSIHAHGDRELLHSAVLVDGIAQGLSSWCARKIATSEAPGEDAPSADAPPFVLDSYFSNGDDTVAVHLSLATTAPRKPLWNRPTVLTKDANALLEQHEIHQLINQSVDRTIFEIAPPQREFDESKYLKSGALGAMRLIFRNQNGDLEAARKQLDRNFALDPRGIYAAWKAYILTLYRGERDGTDVKALREEADALVRKALELDPYDAMTLALCSYVQSYLLGNKETGFDLASRSIDMNRSNPLAWAFRGAAKFNVGRSEEAYRDITFARKISGEGPYRYVLDAFACVAAALTDRLDEAAVYGEISNALSPGYRAPLRYLAAIYAARGEHDKLESTLNRIREFEPGFTLEMLEEASYPVQSLRNSAASVRRLSGRSDL